jgi:hypothetical protein
MPSNLPADALDAKCNAAVDRGYSSVPRKITLATVK